MLALATGLQAAALARLEPRESLALEPLDADGGARDRRPVRPGRQRDPGRRRCVATTAASPAASTRPRANGPAARRPAASTRSPTRRRPAAARRARSRPSWPGASSICSRPASAWPDSAAPGIGPTSRWSARTRASRRSTATTPSTSSAAKSSSPSWSRTWSARSLLARRRPVRERQVVRACARVCCPRSRAACCRAASNWTQAVIRPGAHPLRELRRATRRLAPTSAACSPSTSSRSSSRRAQDERERTEFVAGAAREFRGGVVVVVVRADFYGRCAAYPELSRALGANHVLVGAMSRDELRRAIERPAQRAGLSVEPELVAGAAGRRRRPARRAAAALDGAAGALDAGATGGGCSSRRTRAPAACRAPSRGWPRTRSSRSHPAQQAAARTLLLRLSDEDPSGAIVRRRIALDAAGRRGRRPAHRAPAADRQRGHRRGRARGAAARMAAAARLAGRGRAGPPRAPARSARPRARGTRTRATPAASTAARGWPPRSTGRPSTMPSWNRPSGRSSTPRAAPAGAPSGACAWSSPASAALLVVAVIAGVVALDQRNQARDQATVAAAQRLGAQALASGDLDRSLLLARQGVALADSAQTRGNLLAALLKSPAAIGVLRRRQRPADGPSRSARDGRTLAVLSGDSRLSSVRHRDPAPARPPADDPRRLVRAEPGVRPRRSRLAVGGERAAGARCPHASHAHAAGHELGPSTTLRFSADGRTLFAAARLACRGDRRPALRRAQRRAARARRVRARTATARRWCSSTRDGRRIVTSVGRPDGRPRRAHAAAAADARGPRQRGRAQP